MQLNKIQDRFSKTLMDSLDALENTPEDFAALFDEGDIPLPERLKVYRGNVLGGLSGIIVQGFPLLEKLVGEEFLKVMARGYAQEHTPVQGCLNTYGESFDSYIRELEAAKALPYLPDVAALEIAMTESYYAGDDSPLTTEELSKTPPEELNDLELRPRASARLISSRYPLRAIRDFCLDENRAEDATLDLTQGPDHLMVYRPGIEVLIVALEEGEYTLLRHLSAGTALGEAVEKTLEAHEHFNFQAFLPKHVELETFCTINP